LKALLVRRRAGAFAGSTSAEVLKLLFGLILIAAALKAFPEEDSWLHVAGILPRNRKNGLIVSAANLGQRKLGRR
jgi:uncharacterized membrane protein YfcA